MSNLGHRLYRVAVLFHKPWFLFRHILLVRSSQTDANDLSYDRVVRSSTKLGSTMVNEIEDTLAEIDRLPAGKLEALRDFSFTRSLSKSGQCAVLNSRSIVGHFTISRFSRRYWGRYLMTTAELEMAAKSDISPSCGLPLQRFAEPIFTF